MSLALSEVVSALERLAPLRFAESWDNVGLLVEPEADATTTRVTRALLTIDVEAHVLSEAEALGASLVIAYHPPIFRGLTRLRGSDPAEGLLVRCLRQGLSVYSPHTALDAAPDGVNDWLLGAFDSGLRQPCFAHPDDPRYGSGRSLTLDEPIALAEAVRRIKRHLGLSHVRVATPEGREAEGRPTIRRVAVCAGAGGSVFEKLTGYDLYLTGELRHHDVRAKCAQGASVVLCEHTNTERGFLPKFAERLTAETSGAVSFHVSQCDRDPLRVF